jgi:hypothetical protein
VAKHPACCHANAHVYGNVYSYRYIDAYGNVHLNADRDSNGHGYAHADTDRDSRIVTSDRGS